MPAVCSIKVRRCCGKLEVVLAWYVSEIFFCAVQKIALRKEWSFPFHATTIIVRKVGVCPILALYTLVKILIRTVLSRVIPDTANTFS